LRGETGTVLAHSPELRALDGIGGDHVIEHAPVHPERRQHALAPGASGIEGVGRELDEYVGIPAGQHADAVGARRRRMVSARVEFNPSIALGFSANIVMTSRADSIAPS